VKRLYLPLLLLAAACQPEARRLLVVDLTLADPIVLDQTAEPWKEAGYHVEYRRFYPHLTRADLQHYRTVLVLGGREPQAPSDALTIGDLAILNEWIRGRDGVVVLGYAGDAPTARGQNADGTADRWVMNRWLASQGAGITIGSELISAPASPLPHSALDNAGFAPFPAGYNHALQVRDRSQVLARAPASALVAATRVDDGLVVVASRNILGAAGDDAGTHAFLVELARWTRRPAEWAHVRAASRNIPLHLADAPQAVALHPPALRAPEGTMPAALPRPRAGGGEDDSVAVPAWIARQGMRVLWSRFTPQALDSLLAFVDIAALNTLATVIPVGALADTLATRNVWRVTAERMQATSIRWFPSVSTFALVSLGEPLERATRVSDRRRRQLDNQENGAADEINRHGDLIPVACGLDSLFWRQTLRPAFHALTRLGGARPEVITGVGVDLDSAMTYYHGSGFCDSDFRVGLAGLGLDSADLSRALALPPAARYDTLLERGWLARYFSALEDGVAERAVTLGAELRRLHPDLRFAFHASRSPADWFSLGLLRGLSTREAPVLLWLSEPRARDLVRGYRERQIYGLAAIRIEADRTTFAPSAAARLHTRVFSEGAGFWLDGTVTDSLGRVIRRFVK
jgi:hypothetical protein